MPFSLPIYRHPDLSESSFKEAPLAQFVRAEKPGVAPENYHATSIYPEYFHLKKGVWDLPRESRMDCVVVLEDTGALVVKEFRNIKAGDFIACGRHENGEDGIFVHTQAFDFMDQSSEKFAFRSRITRETSFSIDYDELYDLLEFEREHGFIVWVLGPAVVFDRDARNAFAELVNRGYVHALLAGNALATHDVEASLFSTGLGQDIYSKRTVPLGHYNHLDAINTIRRVGALARAIDQGIISDGVMRAVIAKEIPYVLAGSIRDDGPLPEVVADAYIAQDHMRTITRKATTVIAMATQLHAIATGNMAPSYRMEKDGTVRPVYFYTVDMSEFAVNKLANRGSLTARSILTNVQDFVVTVERGLRMRAG
jgi:lysine-ketoglutarate reductase/saccharopine dehydrogenase-like protein (TIGR00300 family)